MQHFFKKVHKVNIYLYLSINFILYAITSIYDLIYINIAGIKMLSTSTV